MNTTTVKVAILGLLLCFLVTACSRTGQRGRSYTIDPTKPEFSIAPADLATPAVLGTNSTPSGAHATIVVRVQLSAASTDAFRQFTREHKNQQIQLVIDSKVVAEPFVFADISDGRTELAFSSLAEAREVRNALKKK